MSEEKRDDGGPAFPAGFYSAQEIKLYPLAERKK